MQCITSLLGWSVSRGILHEAFASRRITNDAGGFEMVTRSFYRLIKVADTFLGKMRAGTLKLVRY